MRGVEVVTIKNNERRGISLVTAGANVVHAGCPAGAQIGNPNSIFAAGSLPLFENRNCLVSLGLASKHGIGARI